MDILILNTYDLKGGASRAAYRLHKGFQQIGHNSQMLVQVKYGDDCNVIGSNSIIEKGLGMVRPYLDTIPARLHSKWNKTLFSTAFLSKKIDDKVIKIDPEIISLHWIVGGFIAPKTLKKLNKPLVWTLHDSWAFTGGCHIPFNCKHYTKSCGKCPTLGSSKNHDLSRLIWYRKKRNWKNLNITIVTPSRWLCECAQSSSLFQDYRIEVIPNGLDLQIYKPVEKRIARNILGFPEDKKLILFGAMYSTSDPNKGFHLLQSALQNLSKNGWTQEIELIIFGASEPANPPNLYFESHYLGHLHDDVSLSILYSAADVMIVPSIQEAFGQTALEAMACGTPVVAFGATGLLDIVDHKITGYLAKPYDPIDLARGIEWILEDDKRWEKLSIKSQEKITQEFDIEIIAQKYVELYQEILKS
ncbi:glycosyl transferase group 1 [Methanosalsum zhilinae DSM 4017]|uniref:Glycosyl transferase group 1 n=1 Tax=Methanosalsum zhilinae (strain DSM 4017 / NBRC 107636 / OCM 62 / WeN5) TaxID=679901 RepID=F7XPW4_METZD|nr:glycosyltransferase family 4 protein [Methanosalsum zhilinae]AEH61485.1 glycosyl transferase group 1 [Methanosalsum zhilinae DSM 4017]